MLSGSAISLLLIVGVVAAVVAMFSGLRGLYTPRVVPFWLRRKRRHTPKGEPAAKKPEEDSDLQRRRAA